MYDIIRTELYTDDNVPIKKVTSQERRPCLQRKMHGATEQNSLEIIFDIQCIDYAHSSLVILATGLLQWETYVYSQPVQPTVFKLE